MNADRQTNRLFVDESCPKFDRNLQIMCKDHIPDLIPVSLIVFELSCSQTERLPMPDKRCQQHAVFPGGHPPKSDRARCCLTAMTRREPVLSAWYGRWLYSQTDRHNSKLCFSESGRSKRWRFVKISSPNFVDDYNTFTLHTSYMRK
ncbi:hypothetical protein AVEN_169008-1 [Araneus ventricosus]|uniref:Uncharacterized protein n=1 Tax=Araneus ventricosus TaxID=182803 RepID=A0A4Y2UJZ7_ARAVE|nr:hypothetical protein AVEN_82625-1 [Araneus ventricosus]GBO12461.1 hypothetical protein AVEN_122206-1 [Araneus ventricosus]GBO12609.1 hypothetical protein AVEN_40051-1 [Araneus ventricosus]GBO12664.1 hypothetical protein AVEN_169008-1 [Araneus ventricosus]